MSDAEMALLDDRYFRCTVLRYHFHGYGGSPFVRF